MIDQNKPTPPQILNVDEYAVIDGFDNSVYITNATSTTMVSSSIPTPWDSIDSMLINQDASFWLDFDHMKYDAGSKTLFAYGVSADRDMIKPNILYLTRKIDKNFTTTIASSIHVTRYDMKDSEEVTLYEFERLGDQYKLRVYPTEKLRDYWFAMWRASGGKP